MGSNICVQQSNIMNLIDLVKADVNSSLEELRFITAQRTFANAMLARQTANARVQLDQSDGVLQSLPTQLEYESLRLEFSELSTLIANLDGEITIVFVNVVPRVILAPLALVEGQSLGARIVGHQEPALNSNFNCY